MSPTCKTRIKLTVVNEQCQGRAGFGQGSAALLHGVVETGSLNMAAKQLGMAYSKAWRLIKHSEEELGFTLLNRDGARGSSLTEEGQKFLKSYDELVRNTRDYADKEFNRLFCA